MIVIIRHHTEYRTRQMRKKITRGIIIVLINIIVIIAALEALLRYIDPLGAYANYASAFVIQNRSYGTEDGFAIEAGKMNLPGFWTVTMLEDNTRLVPNSSESDCKIAFVGDSFTFGWGVSDDETWVNQLAEDLPQASFYNTGKNAYNITNVRQTIENYPADGYIYLIFDNDAELNEPFTFSDNGYLTGITSYIFFATFYKGEDIGQQAYSSDPNAPMMVNYFSELETLTARDDVLIFGLTNHPLIRDSIERSPSVIPLNYQYENYVNSYADNHSTPEGNKIIAERMLPYVAPFVDKICN